MSKKQDTVWRAPPHTLAKIAILRSYLEKWFSIIGLTFANRSLWYIDGFAGPGEYDGGQDGSPIAAVKAAKNALDNAGGRWKARDIRCVFIEEDAARFANLARCLDRCQKEARIAVKPINSAFVAGLVKLKQDTGNPFRSGEPIFAFIDPFGAKGMPFTAVQELLSRPTAEVLINLDSDGIDRIYSAGKHADHDRLLTEVFGDTDWKSLQGISRMHERTQAILALYKSKLRKIPGVRYVFSFEMRSANHSIDYHLVFASQNSRGLEKMKESMRQLDQDGGYRFCDENVGQTRLFRFDDPLAHAMTMHEAFRGVTTSYDDVNDYALNESPFVNAKAMLKELENRGLIEVNSERPRRKGTYPEHLKLQIYFREEVSNG